MDLDENCGSLTYEDVARVWEKSDKVSEVSTRVEICSKFDTSLTALNTGIARIFPKSNRVLLNQPSIYPPVPSKSIHNSLGLHPSKCYSLVIIINRVTANCDNLHHASLSK